MQTSIIIINHRAEPMSQVALKSVAVQSHKPTEVVFADLHPSEGKVAECKAILAKTGIWFSYIEAIGQSLGEARNMAAQAAQGEVLVFTLAEAHLPDTYFKDIQDAFGKGAVKALAGHWHIGCMPTDALWQRAAYIVADGYAHPFDDNFHPSGANLALRKNLLEQFGFFPDWLSYAADDVVLVKLLRKKGYPVALLPRIGVWLEPLHNQKAYIEQAYQQGLGEGEAHLNYLQFIGIVAELLLRLGWGICLLLLLVGVALGWPVSYVLLLPLAVLVPGFLPYRRLFFSWLKRSFAQPSFKVFVKSIVLFELATYAYFKGYRKGYFFQTDFRRAAVKKLKQTLG